MHSSAIAITIAMMLVLSTYLYMLPTIAARNKRDFWSIALFNLSMGWTVVGWILAWVWKHYSPLTNLTIKERFVRTFTGQLGKESNV